MGSALQFSPATISTLHVPILETSPQSSLRRIGLLYDTSQAFDRKVMAGVAAWLKDHQEFCLHIQPDLASLRLQDLDGIIANLDDEAVRKAVAVSGLPVVGFRATGRGREPERGIPCLSGNDSAIASLAADHLIACGLRHFGYYGEAPAAFITRLGKHGFTCSVFRDHESRLADWLRALPRPAGIMAAGDMQARRILETCRASGIEVPGEVAVVGVGNDELLCELGHTTLTSIETGATKLGYEAAALLDNLLSGKHPAELHITTEPAGIIGRQSTESVVVRDRVVSKAMSLIQSKVSEGIRVHDVARAVAVSRPSLERRFRKEFGRTIREVIRGVQLESAKRLVAESDLPLKQVAVNTGFRSVQYMTTLFRRTFGHPPAVYRHRASL